MDFDTEAGGEQTLEEALVSDGEEELIAANEVNAANYTLEEVEKRLEIGEIVKNELIAYSLYCKYAKLKGFSVRKGRNLKFKDGCGEVQAKFFLCSCEGSKDSKSSKSRIPDFQKTTFRCGCKAQLKVARRKGAVWRVTQFKKEHNHELYAPDEAYVLRSARKITDEQELMLTTMLHSGIPVATAYNYLEKSVNGREHVGFMLHDAYNRLNCEKRKSKVENRDTLELLQHFIDKSNKEPNFFWKVEVDDDNRLMNFFCRDYKCMIDYENFGDLLSFDTTYKTNKFHLICAPFIGINHHHDNVMFGFALLSDEKQSTFEWLFKVFLESMGGKQPGIVFTDQCKAMMNAIDVVFPDAHHRLCQWHISQNAPSFFGDLNYVPEFLKLWNTCMTYCKSEDEFEATWKVMVDNYGIGTDDWFEDMYKLRHRWATTFSDHLFTSGLLTTSRSEGTNSALKKKIVNCTSSLLFCVTSYEEVQQNWRANEKENDILSRHNQPTLFVSSNPLVKHAATVYTLTIFKLFEKELQDTMGLELPKSLFSGGSSSLFFQVKKYNSSRPRVVEYTQELEIKCGCHKFETVGILCKHSLKVLDFMGVHSIPDNYIKKRWTKATKTRAYVEHTGSGAGEDNARADTSYVYQMAYVNQKIKDVRDLALLGIDDGEGRDLLSKYIDDAKKGMNDWVKSKSLKDLNAFDDFGAGKDNLFPVKDPLTAKSRGMNNVQRRHWDDKRKGKGKRKAESSRKTGKATKRKGEKSQGGVENSSLQQVDNLQWSQGAINGQVPPQSIGFEVHGLGGEFNRGMNGYVANAYPFRMLNMDMSSRQGN